MHSFQTLKSASLQFFWFISSSGPEGFDQEAAAVLMARYAVFKCENEETEDLKWSIFCHRMCFGGLTGCSFDAWLIWGYPAFEGTII